MKHSVLTFFFLLTGLFFCSFSNGQSKYFVYLQTEPAQPFYIKINNQNIDNTTEPEIEAWLNALVEINPEQVMIYTLDREAPVNDLEKIPVPELNKIALRVKEKGFKVSVSG